MRPVQNSDPLDMLIERVERRRGPMTAEDVKREAQALRRQIGGDEYYIHKQQKDSIVLP